VKKQENTGLEVETAAGFLVFPPIFAINSYK
jgi:hypothetical protein